MRLEFNLTSKEFISLDIKKCSFGVWGLMCIYFLMTFE